MSRPGEAAGEPAVVIVTGPTASGKSALALALARAFRGCVINADAMQVYRELRILTARPDAAARRAVPHRLYGMLPARERCSAVRWRQLALDEIHFCAESGRLPILAGGTGLYLKVLEEGLAHIPPLPPEARVAALDRLEEVGLAGLRAEIAARDPAILRRVHPNDRQRLLRAWEVLQATGRPLSQWQSQPGERAGLRLFWLTLDPPRDALAAVCDARFSRMLAAGALAEVRRLLALRLDPGLPAMKALGVPELARHLAGELSLEQAAAAARAATRRYAKRQRTWLRTQVVGRKAPILVKRSQYSESLLPEIFSNIEQFLLTGTGRSG